MQEFIEQSASGIRFYLLRAAVEESQLTILESANRSWRGYNVDAKILGESHLISIANEHTVLQEICACTDLTVPKDKLMESGKLAEVAAPVVFKNNELSYSFNYTFHRFTTDQEYTENLPLFEDLNSENVIFLSYIFPIHPLAPQHDPVTKVYVTFGEQIMVNTLHTYPNEKAFVTTTSSIEIH